MRYVAAYLLAVLGGSKDSPTAKDIDKILSSVGIESDPEKVKKVIAELAGKSVEEVIKEGNSKLASLPSGGGGAAASASETPAAGSAPSAAKVEKKEEKKESESEDDDMGFGLFD